jgi:ParB-like chromosome segregation protein Spo0J
MHVVIMPTDWLVPGVPHPRIHSAERVKETAADIAEFGFSPPIGALGDGTIIIGLVRFLAARSLDLEEVPVIFFDHLTEGQRRALMTVEVLMAESALWDVQKQAAWEKKDRAKRDAR